MRSPHAESYEHPLRCAAEEVLPRYARDPPPSPKQQSIFCFPALYQTSTTGCGADAKSSIGLRWGGVPLGNGAALCTGGRDRRGKDKVDQDRGYRAPPFGISQSPETSTEWVTSVSTVSLSEKEKDSRSSTTRCRVRLWPPWLGAPFPRGTRETGPGLGFNGVVMLPCPWVKNAAGGRWVRPIILSVPVYSFSPSPSFPTALYTHPSFFFLRDGVVWRPGWFDGEFGFETTPRLR
ncbi:hypothetical protein B0T25DRAFT_28956 [Lasiosphaeria hispida]|uniref:Uncharacterized protein n=1 Tax=Lasiosphaeria hispida TaxID=260671 RepID=A0AAJ0MJU9_9PEZI|nr:hypothetical protein B0T25DRAFT_28956 [Lasiosphaeria hispida]